MDGIKSVVGILDTHRGRDKVIRTLQYAATLCSASLPARYGDVSEVGSLVGKLAVFSKSLGETRTILRLLDDLPAWFRLLRGNKVTYNSPTINPIMRVGGLTSWFLSISHYASTIKHLPQIIINFYFLAYSEHLLQSLINPSLTLSHSPASLLTLLLPLSSLSLSFPLSLSLSLLPLSLFLPPPLSLPDFICA